MTNKRKRKSPAKPRNRAGLLPNQYRRRATVHVERTRGEHEAHRYSPDEFTVTDIYNVETMRTDGQWAHRIDFHGETYVIPGKVVDQLIRHRESIIKEQRSDKGREVQQQRLKTLAQMDQEAARLDEDMTRDLGG